MFAHSYSEDSHGRASVNNALICSSVFSWRRNDMAESSSLRSGAGIAHFTLTAQRQQSYMDRNGLSSSVEQLGRLAEQNADDVDGSCL